MKIHIEKSNWYGAFSSGEALVFRLDSDTWHRVWKQLHKVVSNKYAVKDEYKCLELDRANGTTGTSSIAVNNTKENKELMENLISGKL